MLVETSFEDVATKSVDRWIDLTNDLVGTDRAATGDWRCIDSDDGRVKALAMTAHSSNSNQYVMAMVCPWFGILWFGTTESKSVLYWLLSRIVVRPLERHSLKSLLIQQHDSNGFCFFTCWWRMKDPAKKMKQQDWFITRRRASSFEIGPTSLVSPRQMCWYDRYVMGGESRSTFLRDFAVITWLAQPCLEE